MKINEIAFIAYAVTDMERARKFYEGALGLKPSSAYPVTGDSKWIEYDIGATTLGIGSSPQWQPSRDGASVALEVEDFDQAIAKLKEHGIAFEMGPLETPVCHMAVIRDPDGSKICIHKRKSSNK
jgi:predicted enzyme related to lactoylglutathione lyase